MGEVELEFAIHTPKTLMPPWTTGHTTLKMIAVTVE